MSADIDIGEEAENREASSKYIALHSINTHIKADLN